MTTTIEIPEDLYEAIKRRAANEGVSMRSLIVGVLEEAYAEPKGRKGRMVTGPMVRIKGKLGPRFPTDENPWDLILG